MKNRVKFVIFVIAMFMIVLISRIYYLSIKSNEYYEKLADKNIYRTYYEKPVRGVIRDANSIPLAINILGFSIYLKPNLRAKRYHGELERILKKLVKEFPNLKYEKLLKEYKKKDSPYNHKPIEVVSFIPYDKMINKYVKLTLNKNIIIEPSSKRFYPQESLASHVIGYTGKANKKDIKNDIVARTIGVVGKSGLERYYNDVLEGELGEEKVVVSADNRVVKSLSKTNPKSSDITLSLDIVLQKYIAEIFEGKSGAVIVMNAKNGEILAAGSFPEYDPNIFVNGIDSKTWKRMITDFNHPFTNKLVNGLYPPGSSIKPSMALAFLNSKKVGKYKQFLCEGAIKLGHRKFRCWNSRGHGLVDMKKAIESSCDVYFYDVSLEVGIKEMSKNMIRYGYGRKTGVDLPNEFLGTMPSREWKLKKYSQPWYMGETLNTSIGQGNFLVTPMQIAVTTAGLAVGYQATPHFVKKMGEINLDYEKRKPYNEFELKQLPFIRSAMYSVMYGKRGTARKHIFSKIHIAGKTGTAQVIGISQEEKKRMSEDELKLYHRSHAWLTTFGPYEDPTYVVTVLVEHGGHGGSAAGGIVSKIYNKLIELGYIDKRFVISN